MASIYNGIFYDLLSANIQFISQQKWILKECPNIVQIPKFHLTQGVHVLSKEFCLSKHIIFGVPDATL